MGTTAEKLQAVLNSKNEIKGALTLRGKNPGDVMSDYAALIGELANTDDATATASKILEGFTAYVNGQKVTGTIKSKPASTIVPGRTDVIMAPYNYLAGSQTIKGDPNLLASNIRKGTSIFNVAGSLEELKPEVQTFDISAGTLPINVAVAETNGSRIIAITTSNNKAVYSDNGGDTWTAFTISSGYKYTDMIYADGKFVVAAEGDFFIYSDNGGTTWKTSYVGLSALWSSIAYGKGTFVAVAKGSNKAIISTDGVTWTQKTMPGTTEQQDWRAVRWCGDRFVAVAKNSSKVAQSYDGIAWTSFSVPSAAAWCDVAYGNGKTIIISGGEDQTTSRAIVTNTHGTSIWGLEYLPTQYNYRRIAYNNGVWIITTNTGHILYSYTGSASSWTDYNMTNTIALRRIVYHNGTFVLPPSCNSAQHAAIITTKLPPTNATYLGSATPEEVPSGVVFSSVHGFGLIGKGAQSEAETYVVENLAGTAQTLATLSHEQAVVPTATPNDIRLGTTAITNDGYTTGEKDIPAYHSRTGMKIIQAGEPVSVNISHYYDYTRIQVTISKYNTSTIDSVEVIQSSIDDSIYTAGTTQKAGDITKDDITETINFGITATEKAVLRYFLMKEEV